MIGLREESSNLVSNNYDGKVQTKTQAHVTRSRKSFDEPPDIDTFNRSFNPY